MKRLPKALWFSLAINLAIVVGDLVAAPIHAAGHSQGLLGYIDGAAHILGLPGFMASEVLGMRPNHLWTWRAFWLEFAFNLTFWMLAASFINRMKAKALAYCAGPVNDTGNVSPSTGPALLTRRRMLFGGGRAMAGAGMASGSWGFFGEARWFEITNQSIRIKGLPARLDGLRIVHLSDIHHGAWMSLAWVRQIVDVTNSLAPDVVALTGDYIYRGVRYVTPVARELARLRPNICVAGVMGNHDWLEKNGEQAKATFAREGVPLIDNARVFITPQRQLAREAREGLCIAGVGDLWEDKCLYKLALGGVPAWMPRILLSHNPDVAEDPEFLRTGYRVDLMLSGHTHGGQISIPGVGAPVTNSAYGQRYAQGLVQGPVCPVFVSRGLGMTVMPVRVGVRPEIALLELRAA